MDILVDKMYNNFLIYKSKTYNKHFKAHEYIKKLEIKNIEIENVIYTHKQPVSSIFSHKGKVICSSFDSRISIFNELNQEVKIYSGHYKGVTDVFIIKTLIFSISFDQTLKTKKYVKKRNLNFTPYRLQVDRKSNRINQNCRIFPPSHDENTKKSDSFFLKKCSFQ